MFTSIPFNDFPKAYFAFNPETILTPVFLDAGGWQTMKKLQSFYGLDAKGVTLEALAFRLKNPDSPTPRWTGSFPDDTNTQYVTTPKAWSKELFSEKDLADEVRYACKVRSCLEALLAYVTTQQAQERGVE